MDFSFDNIPLLNHDEKTDTINNHGPGFTEQDRSEPDHAPDDQQPFFPTFKSPRIDYIHQPNKSMPMRSVANNMLSFSSHSSSTTGEKNQTPSLFSFYQPSSANIRNTGLQAGVHMPVSRYKGPFTPSQWMELEHQALIYKHLVANVPVPPLLLNPLRRSLDTFLFPGSSSSISYAPNSYGWGSFHLGFSGNNTDPEPGRCRRTDGKKWRCSRDAVPDQKYCERHINRGRHRSRKPVEGHKGHAVSGSTAPKVGPLVSSSSIPVSRETPKTRKQESEAVAIINPFSAPKQHNSIKESEDSLIYPTNYTSFLDQSASNTNPLPHFVDDWTQLSMSIPVTSSDFSSSSNSPAHEKLEFDLDPTRKQLSNWIPISWGNSLGGPLGEVLNRTSNSNGEKRKNGSTAEMNQMTEMWDDVNYHMGSSPTGVLQKTTIVSPSDSSSGSSPKDEKKDGHLHGSGIGDELLLATVAG